MRRLDTGEIAFTENELALTEAAHKIAVDYWTGKLAGENPAKGEFLALAAEQAMEHSQRQADMEALP